MSKHTPGPWVWISATAGERDDWGSPTPGPIDVSSFRSNSYSSNPELVGADGDIVVSAGGGEYVPYHGQTDIRMVANARLIASAPELLDVLKELQESAAYWSEYDVPLGIVDRIRAAIAKATGGNDE